MTTPCYEKNYQTNKELRKSFNDLADLTFGINFEKWYEKGYWTERYEPHSYIIDGKVIANVSVNKLDLIVHNSRKKAIQIGTVMTHPDYRNKGLSKKLMNKVLKEYENHIDVFYLYANDSVLDYYPKYGFQKVNEHIFSMPFQGKSQQKPLNYLNGHDDNDLAFIYEFAKKRQPNSTLFSTSNTDELLMFYSIYVYPESIVYMEEEGVIVFYQIDGDTLYLADVVSHTKFNLNSILSRLADEKVEKVIFGYNENSLPSIETSPMNSRETLFVKMNNEIDIPKVFKHPDLSQA
ncbi:GNAT family N-acetyltransferase [Bacillus sp. UMB0899]|nr:GNAT family N-acetyltransferase [Bacillus sp. UMB0899]